MIVGRGKNFPFHHNNKNNNAPHSLFIKCIHTGGLLGSQGWGFRTVVSQPRTQSPCPSRPPLHSLMRFEMSRPFLKHSPLLSFLSSGLISASPHHFRENSIKYTHPLRVQAGRGLGEYGSSPESRRDPAKATQRVRNRARAQPPERLPSLLPVPWAAAGSRLPGADPQAHSGVFACGEFLDCNLSTLVYPSGGRWGGKACRTRGSWGDSSMKLRLSV